MDMILLKIPGTSELEHSFILYEVPVPVTLACTGTLPAPGERAIETKYFILNIYGDNPF